MQILVMSIAEKRAFVQSAIQRADDALIETLYQELMYDFVLKEKLSSRAERAEVDIKSGRVMDIHALKGGLDKCN